MKTRFILGAYAAFPPMEPGFAGSPRESDFYRGLRNLPHVSGLEIPFTGHLQSSLLLEPGVSTGVEWLADHLDQGWEIVVTALPGQMQTMAKDPLFGLASGDEGGRQRAVDFILRLSEDAQELLHLRPDLRLRAIEVHSGPRPVEGGPPPSSEALARSLISLSADELLRRSLCLEHCDAWAVDLSGRSLSAKGFLSLSQEIHALEEMQKKSAASAGGSSRGVAHGLALESANGIGPIPIVINWGRSALEGRSARTPLEHLRRILQDQSSEVEARMRLGGLVFSGATTGHALYGSAQEDSHSPLAEAWQAEGGEGAEAMLLTLQQAHACMDLVRERAPEAFLALKVQPLPREMGIEGRLNLLSRHLELLMS